jgi:hypothetical protein
MRYHPTGCGIADTHPCTPVDKDGFFAGLDGPEFAFMRPMRRLAGALLIAFMSFTGCAGPGYHAYGGHHSGFHHRSHHGSGFLTVLEGAAAIAHIASDLAEVSAHSQPAGPPPAGPATSEEPARPLPGLIGR